MRQIHDTSVTVIGAGRSGLAAARLLVDRGARVFLSEAGPGNDDARKTLTEMGVQFEFGGHTDRAHEAELMVLSPGVPTAAPPVQKALANGVPVVSELELASWFCDSPMVAVTGSNGKTTTTSLLAHVMHTAGRPHLVAGNIGSPLSAHVQECAPKTVVVLEVSSFQLDHIEAFRPRVSVLLNLTPDHLDRYDDDFSKYAASKFGLFRNQRPDGAGGGPDVLVYNDDDPVVRAGVRDFCHQHSFQAHAFSIDRPVARGAFVRDDHLILRVAPHQHPQEEVLMSTQDLSLRGRHNLYNSLAAAISARAMEISSDVIRESLASFEGVPHRLETVRELHGIKYVNDSKATNVNALWYALESFAEPVVLIAGGRDKGNDYGPVIPLVKERCRGVIGIGESGDKVVYELGDHARAAARAADLKEAIQYARLMAEPGDTILLSPACASFDQFADYEERGDTFKRLVHEL